jgi:hypothetical protein
MEERELVTDGRDVTEGFNHERLLAWELRHVFFGGDASRAREKFPLGVVGL